jgi:hypothetical protein
MLPSRDESLVSLVSLLEFMAASKLVDGDFVVVPCQRFLSELFGVRPHPNVQMFGWNLKEP